MKKLFTLLAITLVFVVFMSSCTEEEVKPKGDIKGEGHVSEKSF